MSAGPVSSISSTSHVAVFCLDAGAACEFLRLLYLHSGELSVTFCRTLDEIRLQARLRIPDRIVIRKADCTEGDELEQVFSWPKEVQKRVVFVVPDERDGRQISYRGQHYPLLVPGEAIRLG
jgi:acyl-CoA synthetase (AMP-forming)/AMP-acid ligase II